MKYSYVYIITNAGNTVLYTGVTTNIIRRIYEHREGLVQGFSKRYRVKKLIYFEVYKDIRDAISREKQIKGGSRAKKLDLISSFNPLWEDLFYKL
jgi:putative endonuclease